MNKTEFIAMVAEKTGQTKVLTATVVEGVFGTLKDRLYQEDDVSIAGFGKFFTKKRKARTARNPQTGGTVDVPAKNVCGFKPAKELKEYIQDEA